MSGNEDEQQDFSAAGWRGSTRLQLRAEGKYIIFSPPPPPSFFLFPLSLSGLNPKHVRIWKSLVLISLKRGDVNHVGEQSGGGAAWACILFKAPNATDGAERSRSPSRYPSPIAPLCSLSLSHPPQLWMVVGFVLINFSLKSKTITLT